MDKIEKLKQELGEDIIIYKHDQLLLIATNKKLPMNAYNIITYRDVSEEQYEEVVKSYID